MLRGRKRHGLFQLGAAFFMDMAMVREISSTMAQAHLQLAIVAGRRTVTGRVWGGPTVK